MRKTEYLVLWGELLFFYLVRLWFVLLQCFHRHSTIHICLPLFVLLRILASISCILQSIASITCFVIPVSFPNNSHHYFHPVSFSYSATFSHYSCLFLTSSQDTGPDTDEDDPHHTHSWHDTTPCYNSKQDTTLGNETPTLNPKCGAVLCLVVISLPPVC